MTPAEDIPVSRVAWKGAVRIIRSAYPPIDLFDEHRRSSRLALAAGGRAENQPARDGDEWATWNWCLWSIAV